MSAGPSPARARSAAQANAAAIVFGIGAVDGDSGNAVAARLVGEDAHRRLLEDSGVDSAVWLFSMQKTAGSRPCGAEIDRFVPLAERRSAFADERDGDAAAIPRARSAIAMPAIDSVLTDSGAVAGRMPHSKSPMCRSLPSIGGPCLRHLRVEHHAHRRRLGAHRERDAEVADDRSDDVALPAAIGDRATPRRAAVESRRRRSLPVRATGIPFPGMGRRRTALRRW